MILRRGDGMQASMIMIVFFIVKLILKIILGIWTYKDSNARGMNGLLWAVIVFIVPNLIGMLIYLVIRSKGYTIDCSNCNTKIDYDSKYCKKCGEEISYDDSLNKVKEGKNNKLALIIVIILVIFSVFGYSGITFLLNSQNTNYEYANIIEQVVEDDVDYSIRLREYNKTINKGIKFDNEKNKVVKYKFNLTDGKAKLIIKDSKGNVIYKDNIIIKKKTEKIIEINDEIKEVNVKVEFENATGEFSVDS